MTAPQSRCFIELFWTGHNPQSKASASMHASNFPNLLHADSIASLSSSSSPFPTPAMLLMMTFKEKQLWSYVLRFHPSCVGRGATIHAVQWLRHLEALRAHFYGKQMFGPSSATFLLRYFADSSQVKLILYPKQRAKPKTSAQKTGESMPHCVEGGCGSSGFWGPAENES
jgi:hypothetical protein